MQWIGIDIGGTNVKAALVDRTGRIVRKSSVTTGKTRTPQQIIDDIARQIAELSGGESYEAIGVGCPGAIDSAQGNVNYSNNLGWVNVPLGKLLAAATGKPVKVSNDANVAALGEAMFGAAKSYSDSILVTLGTGVGGGIVIGGKLFEGYASMGAEIGHTVIRAGGRLCTCGRKGCLEAYASATALIRETISAMHTDFQSKLWAFADGDLNKVDGRTSFECAKAGDKTAQGVVEAYIDALADGIVNLVNVFRSQAVILGGGVCAQGAYLTEPLQKLVDERRYGGADSLRTVIKIAELGNDAGVLGAASLVM